MRRHGISEVKGFAPWTGDLCDLFPLHDSISDRQGRYIVDLYDLYDLAHVAGWEPTTATATIAVDSLPPSTDGGTNRSNTVGILS